MATGGTPRPIIERLGAEARKGMLLPESKAAFEKQGIEGLQMTPAETDAYIKAESAQLDAGAEERAVESELRRCSFAIFSTDLTFHAAETLARRGR